LRIRHTELRRFPSDFSSVASTSEFFLQFGLLTVYHIWTTYIGHIAGDGGTEKETHTYLYIQHAVRIHACLHINIYKKYLFYDSGSRSDNSIAYHEKWIEKEMLWNCRGLVQGTISAFAWRDCGKPQNTSATIAGLRFRDFKPVPPKYEQEC
jgi:hypothetical protein